MYKYIYMCVCVCVCVHVCNYLKAFFAFFPQCTEYPILFSALNSDCNGYNDLILIEPDSKKYFLLAQLLFCKQPLLKPNQSSPYEVLIRTQLLHSPKRWDTSAIQS